MALGDILNSVLNYGVSFNVGGGDFVFGVTLAGLVALGAAKYLWDNYNDALPVVGSNKK